MAYVRFKLMEILVCQSEADTIFPKLGKHIRQGKGGEALEFVDVDKERATLGGRRIRPAESGKPEGRYEQTAQK
jgi:hypothetical protein